MRQTSSKPVVAIRMRKEKIAQLRRAQRELGAKDRTAIVTAAIDEYLNSLAAEGFLSKPAAICSR